MFYLTTHSTHFIYGYMASHISSAESTTLISPFCKFSENKNLMFSRALKNLDFFHSTFIPGLVLYYIAIFKGDIFPHHSN